MKSLLTILTNKRQEKAHKKRVQQVAKIRQIETTYRRELETTTLHDLIQKYLPAIKENQDENALFALLILAVEDVLEMSPYDVQLEGALALNAGNVAEMKTGEGKTLTAIFPTVYHAVMGDKVHVVTVNDYLAERDATQLRPLYEAFHLTTGLNTPQLDAWHKKQAYQCDILYSTANELGFDYLRDNMVINEKNQVYPFSRDFVLIDEVDAILIDEAKTPLIIAQQDQRNIGYYQQADTFVKSLEMTDYLIDIEGKMITLTLAGINKAESFFKTEQLFDKSHVNLMHYIHQALQANFIYQKDIDYAIRPSADYTGMQEIVIIDAFTGRILEGRRFNDGLHQALEAKHQKEHVKIQEETITTATITLQNFFRLYHYRAGMSGTAETEREEFQEVYDMDVMIIPPNHPNRRIDHGVTLYARKSDKWNAVIKKIQELHQKGQPILVGTLSVEDSEYISRRLNEQGLKHVVLNAKQDQHEAEIVAQAGQKGHITIATNMAGRGTDIQLGDDVPETGGLYVLATELNDSRRIDLQLYGRSGRQGDPGETLTIASLEDNLFKRFADQAVIKKAIKSTNQNTVVNLGNNQTVIRQAQEKVEGQGKQARESALQYDNINNIQRLHYYRDREYVLTANTISQLKPYLSDVAEFVQKTTNKALKTRYIEWRNYHTEATLLEYLTKNWFQQTEHSLALETLKALILSVMDQAWIEHIDKLDQSRKGIGFRSMNGQHPVLAYQDEAKELYNQLKDTIRYHTAENLLELDIHQFKERTQQYNGAY